MRMTTMELPVNLNVSNLFCPEQAGSDLDFFHDKEYSKAKDDKDKNKIRRNR